MKYDVYGIGNPLIDILVDANDDFLTKHGLKKGQFHMLDSLETEKIMEDVENMEIIITPGDSTANTLVGVAKLGGTAMFVGRIGDDHHGKYYHKELVKQDVDSNLVKTSLPTGKAICIITPDSQRTFVVSLDAALSLSEEDVLEEDIEMSSIVHLTGYQLEDPGLRKVSFHVLELAKKHGKKVSIDLADPGVIERCLDDFKKIVKEYADILFVNEEEAYALTGLHDKEALQEIAKDVSVAIVKLGAEGSLISKDNQVIRIKGLSVDAIDSTGAGDMYAAGILFGLTHDLSIEKAARIANHAAAEVVKQKGARLEGNISHENI